MHQSVMIPNTMELISLEPSDFSPLISKCQIKVCYVGEEPNRNKSIITKEVATEMAKTIRGSVIVGFYNDNEEDFEEHNRIIDISNGKFEIRETTRPYGFVDLNAKCWFQKFIDDGENEHEYLCTEGWLWTGQYPECKRAIDKGNNHSMELDEKTLDASWTKDDKGNPQFFIINEAIISKLCILGEECEPCFEGSTITKATFSLDFNDDFKNQLFSMMNELKQYIEGGTEKVLNRYAVEIGDSLWSALYQYIAQTYPDESGWCSTYSIDGIFEENSQKFAVLANRKTMKYYRLNFSVDEAEGLVVSDTLLEVTKSYTPAEEPQFAADAVQAYIDEYKKKKEEENSNSQGKTDKSDTEKNEESTEDEKSEEDEFGCKKKKRCSLEESSEYSELKVKYDELENNYNLLKAEKEALENQVSELTIFKANIERKDKEAKIAEFWMLSDEDKADVITNIDTYSLDDIEAKLAVICFRNKVSLTQEDNKPEEITTYNLDSVVDSTPAWVKTALETAKRMK